MRWVDALAFGVTMASLASSCRPQPQTAASSPPPASPEPAPTTTEPVLPTVTRVADFVAAVHGMAVAPDDTLYFSDSFQQLAAPPAIYRLAAPYDGTPEPTGLTGARPAGLEFIEGDLVVCDVGAGTVTRYDPELRPRRSWAVAAPWNVAPTPTGWLAVTHGNELVALDQDGGAVVLGSDLRAPFDLAPTRDGSVWISEQGAGQGEPGRLVRWGPDATVVAEARYEWDNPEGLALAPDGALWVAETEQRALLRVSLDGEVEHMHDVEGLPIVIATTASRDLLVSVTGPSPHLLRVTFAP